MDIAVGPICHGMPTALLFAGQRHDPHLGRRRATNLPPFTIAHSGRSIMPSGALNTAGARLAGLIIPHHANEGAGKIRGMATMKMLIAALATSTFAFGANAMPAEKPAIVLVYGAFENDQVWSMSPRS